jgi:hypothetical protein
VTSGILAALRTGHALAAHAAQCPATVQAMCAQHALRAVRSWRACPAVLLVGSDRPAYYRPERLPLVSFLAVVAEPAVDAPAATQPQAAGRAVQQRALCWKAAGVAKGFKMLHPVFVAQLLRDLYGIQVRTISMLNNAQYCPLSPRSAHHLARRIACCFS